MPKQKYQFLGLAHFVESEASKMRLADDGDNQPLGTARQSKVLAKIANHITQAADPANSHAAKDILDNCEAHVQSLVLQLGAGLAMITEAHSALGLPIPIYSCLNALFASPGEIVATEADGETESEPEPETPEAADVPAKGSRRSR